MTFYAAPLSRQVSNQFQCDIYRTAGGVCCSLYVKNTQNGLNFLGNIYRMADTSRIANWLGTLRLKISESKTFCIVTTFSVLFVDAVLLTAIGK